LVPLRTVDWNDVADIASASAPIFEAFRTDHTVLSGLLDNLAHDAQLQSLCERYDFLDKLVLHDDTVANVRVRLHLFRPGYFDRPHNHRWSFASLILTGSYLHRVFGRDDILTEDTDPDTLAAILQRVEHAGDSYALHHNSVHTVQAAADTISIVLRGPAAKDRFLILDRPRRSSFWVYGAAHETAQQRADKQMTPDQVAETIARVRQLTATAAGAGA
jgi:predicted metal-dependent enzyme (double-stranded beta helix superfamily)